MKKYYKSVSFSLMLLLLVSCGVSRKISKNQQSADKNVVILAVNDMHAAIECFPRFAFIVDSLRNLYPDMLIFSAGDNQTGHPVNDQYLPKGVPMLELMNKVGFNLSAVGNHEFDAGEQGFALLSSMLHHNFTCANLVAPEQKPPFNIKPYNIFTLPNGTKIGAVSFIQINNKGIPDCNPDFAANFKFADPYLTAQTYAKMKDSCDIVVFVNHMGYEEDIKLAELMPANSVDLIIGGHSHTLVKEDAIYNGIRICQAGRDLKYSTLIKMQIKPDGKVESSSELIAVGKKGSENKEVRNMVNAYINNNPFLSRQIGISEDDFTSKEQLGYFMADALASFEPVDFAVINSGGVRISELPKGILTPMDVFKVDPFGNGIVIIKLSGAEIKEFYKAAYYADDYRIVFASGLNSVYTTNGDELVDINLFTPDNKPLDPEKIYKVAMNTYVLSATKFNHKDKGEEKFMQTAENMINYIKNQKIIKSYRDEKRVEIK